MKLYAITDRHLYPGGERDRCSALLRQAARWVEAGVAFIQLREKDLPALELQELATALVELARRSTPLTRTRILINAASGGAAEIGQRAGMDGLHLPAGAGERFERRSGSGAAWPAGAPIVSAACHSVEDLRDARQAQISLALFAPVFAKPLADGRALPGAGLQALTRACEAASPVPVFALGGVTTRNAAECLAAGAAGVAGIRLFMADSWLELLHR